MKIYTRRGDAGETDLFGGERVGKDAPRVEAYGAVDELNATVGAAAAASRHDDVRQLCQRIQSSLFDLGAYLATPEEAARQKGGKGGRRGIPGVDADDVQALEHAIDAFESELEPLKSFILPGGTPAAAAFHVARTVCRRAERRAVSLDRESSLEAPPRRYLNRLSDLLFVIARLENRRAGEPDVPWVGRER